MNNKYMWINTNFFIILQYIILTSGRVRSSKAVPPGRPSLNWDNYLQQPAFADDNVETVVAAAESSAFLHCKVDHLADRAVTWIRKSDVQVLTSNTYRYTSDERISAYSSSSADEWVLKITKVRLDDSGGYECQVSTDPKMSMIFQLNVIVANARIKGPREVFMNSGNDLDVVCYVPRITTPPDFIFWYNGSRIINYSDRPGVKVVTRANTKSSRLIIKKSTIYDTANYTCAPSNAKQTTVFVHILQEETPAAMQHSNRSTSNNYILCKTNLYILFILSIYLQYFPKIWNIL